MSEFKHKRLKIWQSGRNLVRQVYDVTGQFPNSERFGLADQLRRAIVSVPSNIAEGSSRETTSEFIRFLTIARGSLSEVDTQLVLAEDLGYISPSVTLHGDVERLATQISALIGRLRQQGESPSTFQSSKPPPLQTSAAPNVQTSKHPSIQASHDCRRTL